MVESPATAMSSPPAMVVVGGDSEVGFRYLYNHNATTIWYQWGVYEAWVKKGGGGGVRGILFYFLIIIILFIFKKNGGN